MNKKYFNNESSLILINEFYDYFKLVLLFYALMSHDLKFLIFDLIFYLIS